MQEFSIGDVMKITGLSRATILYYEQKGLIHPSQKHDSRYRSYSIEDLTQIMFFQNMKHMDVSVGDFTDALSDTDGGVYPDVETMLNMKKQAYMRKICAEMAMVRYWDQTLAFMNVLRTNMPYSIEQPNYAAWTLKLSSGSRDALSRWDDYFLQRNLSYFFDEKRIAKSDYTFERGLSCYSECALELTPEMRKAVHFKSPRRCLSLILPFDFNEENFRPVFEMMRGILEEKHLVMNGDPWGHFSIRDDKNQRGVNNLFLWIPVDDAVATE